MPTPRMPLACSIETEVSKCSPAPLSMQFCGTGGFCRGRRRSAESSAPTPVRHRCEHRPWPAAPIRRRSRTGNTRRRRPPACCCSGRPQWDTFGSTTAPSLLLSSRKPVGARVEQHVVDRHATVVGGHVRAADRDRDIRDVGHSKHEVPSGPLSTTISVVLGPVGVVCSASRHDADARVLADGGRCGRRAATAAGQQDEQARQQQGFAWARGGIQRIALALVPTGSCDLSQALPTKLPWRPPDCRTRSPWSTTMLRLMPGVRSTAAAPASKSAA